MTLEIKFRAWDEVDGTFIPCHSDLFAEIIERDGFRWPTMQRNPGYPQIHVMQYTGLNDKDGRDIYDGDIVRYKLGGEWVVGDVRYDVYAARYVKRAEKIGELWDYKDLSSYIGSTSVIGNVYENPELLK